MPVDLGCRVMYAAGVAPPVLLAAVVLHAGVATLARNRSTRAPCGVTCRARVHLRRVNIITGRHRSPPRGDQESHGKRTSEASSSSQDCNQFFSYCVHYLDGRV